MRVTAKYAFSGNPQESQLSFPAGAQLETSPEGHHAPRHGWMHGSYQNQRGWFPESYIVEDPSGSTDSCPPSAPPPPPTATAYPYNNQYNGGGDQPFSASAPPGVMAMPVPVSAATTPAPPRKVLREQQLSELIPQGYTRGKYQFKFTTWRLGIVAVF